MQIDAMIYFLISCFGPLAICFHSHLAFDSSHHCCRVHRRWFNTRPFALLPSTAPFISSCLFLPSARREPKVCWSRPLSPRCSPPPALRGNLRQFIPAQTTAQSWTLTPHWSLPQTVGPVVPLAPKVMPLSHDTARAGQRKANEKLCTSLTQPSRTPFLLPLWMLARAPKAGATSLPFLPLCTDPSAKTQCSKLACSNSETQVVSIQNFLFAGSVKVPVHLLYVCVRTGILNMRKCASNLQGGLLKRYSVREWTKSTWKHIKCVM